MCVREVTVEMEHLFVAPRPAGDNIVTIYEPYARDV